jgi:hypothetical protein
MPTGENPDALSRFVIAAKAGAAGGPTMAAALGFQARFVMLVRGPGQGINPGIQATARSIKANASRHGAGRSRFAVKPSGSIVTPRRMVDRSGGEVEITTGGRHDPCVGVRAVAVGEAVMANVLGDHLLRHRAQDPDALAQARLPRN